MENLIKSYSVKNNFKYECRIQLYDTDAAGRLFFAHLFRHIHDAYEKFMETLGFALNKLINESEFLLPIVHAEADYLKVLRHGDLLQILVKVAEIRNRSFIIEYHLQNTQGETVARARTHHVQVSQETNAILLSEHLKIALKASQNNEFL